MKNDFFQMQVFALLTNLLYRTACNGPFKLDFLKEKKHPKPI